MKKLFSVLLLIVVFGGLIIYRESTKKVSENTPLVLSPSVKPTAEIGKTNSQTETTNINSGMSLDIITPADKAIVTVSPIEVKGKTLPGETVFINEKEMKADSMGNFSTTIALDEGENYIIIVANDKEGNYAERDLIITLETQ